MNRFIIIGMPGCGKSSIGRISAVKTGLDFTDLDEMIVREHGDIGDIFRNEGEPAFREYETSALKTALRRRNIVISAGGGIIEKAVNMDLLKNGTVIFIDRDPSHIRKTLDSLSRPLLKDNDDMLDKLYESRLPKYIEAMDYRVDNNGEKVDAVNRLVGIIRETKT